MFHDKGKFRHCKPPMFPFFNNLNNDLRNFIFFDSKKEEPLEISFENKMNEITANDSNNQVQESQSTLENGINNISQEEPSNIHNNILQSTDRHSKELSRKSKILCEIFKKNITDIKKIEKTAWGGIPDQYRARCWRILLRTVNLNNENYTQEIQEKDKKYQKMIQDIQLSDKVKHQIQIDVVRIDPRYKVDHKGKDITSVYSNILSLYASQRPVVGYVQGMSDILIPFIRVFDADDHVSFMESSAYFCFSSFIDNFQENYTNYQFGVNDSIKKMKCIVENLEPYLVKYCISIGLEVHMFAYRWFNCQFVREFNIDLVYLIFDTMFSHQTRNSINFVKFGVFFASSFFISLKDQIINNSFDSVMSLLQEKHRNISYNKLLFLLATSHIHSEVFKSYRY